LKPQPRLGLYSEDARRAQTSRTQRSARAIGIRCDRRFLVLRSHDGESGSNFVALARHVPRSYLESEPHCLQAARTVGTYCRDTIRVAGSGTRSGRNRLVSPPPLGMDISSRDHRDTSRGRCRELHQRRLAARRNWRRHCRSTIAVPFASNNQKRVCLESFSKELEKNVTDKRSYSGDPKIRCRENICHRPSQPLLLTPT
jgi:hypothetical protein